MIVHTVTFKTKHTQDSQAEKDFLEAGSRLQQLPMVKNFHCYRQISSKNDFDFGFSMEFESDEAYQAYNNHPMHCQFVESRWKAEVVDFLEIDYVKYE